MPTGTDVNLILMMERSQELWLKDRDRLVSETNAYLVSLRNALIKKLKSFMDGIAGADPYEALNFQKYLETVMDIDRIIGSQLSGVERNLTEAMKDFAQKQYQTLVDNYEPFIPYVSYTNINARAIQALMTLSKDGKTVSERFNLIRHYATNEVKHTLSLSMAGGWDYPKTVKHLMKITDMTRSAAARSVRTYSGLARNFAQHTFLEDYADSFDGWMWWSDFSPTTCDMCKAKHGKIYKRGEIMVDHWNGHCEMFPIPSGMDPKDLVSERRIRNPYTGQHEIHPGNISYDDWMKKVKP